MHRVEQSNQLSVKYGRVNACKKTLSFVPFHLRADGLTFMVLRLCLCVVIILNFVQQEKGGGEGLAAVTSGGPLAKLRGPQPNQQTGNARPQRAVCYSWGDWKESQASSGHGVAG